MTVDVGRVEAPRASATGYTWFVCIVMMLTLAFNYMDRTVISILVAPIKHEFDVDDTAIGLLQGAAFSVVYVLFLFPLARVADRGNRRNLLLAGVIIWCAATAACGLAQNLPQLFAARIVVAMGEAVGMPCAVSILADYFVPQVRTRALSIYAVGVYVGGALALGAGGSLLHVLSPTGTSASILGVVSPWRGVLIAIGLSGFVLVPLMLLVREPQRYRDDGGVAEALSSLRQFVEEMRSKRVAVCTTVIGFAFVSMAGQTLQAWTPTLFIRTHGWDAGALGVRLGVLTVTLGPLGAILGGVLADRLRLRGHIDSKLIVGGLAAFVSVVASFAMTLGSATVALASAAVLYCSIGVTYGIAQAALADLMPNRMRARTSALYITVNQLLSATLGPLMVGVFNDHVFHDPMKIALSMRIVVPTAFLISFSLLWWGRKALREALALTGTAPRVVVA